MNGTLLYPLFFLLPFVLSLGLTPLLLHWAPRLGLVDQPNERKVHTTPIPRAGGLAIFLSFVLSLPLLPLCHWRFPLLFLALCSIIVLLGLLDDLRPLSWQLRLLVQGLIASAAVITWPTEAALPVRLFAWLWIMALINAFNMLDNMDMLSGGVAWIAAAMFALLLLLWPGDGPRWESIAPFLMLMGALTGFLWFNRPPARIFMGDAGSTFLGFFLGVRSLEISPAEMSSWRAWLIPVCILAVPWYDMMSVIIIRLSQGRSPFQPDKQHLSHRLVEWGLSPVWAVRVIHCLALASGLVGLAIGQLSDPGGTLLAAGLFCWWIGFAVMEYSHRRGGRKKL